MSNHLVQNFKDRVPTQVLPNGAVRWEQFDSNGNSLGYVYLKRADEPTEVGNAWNKIIYDGIKSEFGDVLYITEKASQAEAEGGTNNTKYMTPLTTVQCVDKVKGLKYTGIDISSNANNTIDLTQYLNTSIEKIDVIINAFLTASSATQYVPVKINGTRMFKNTGGKPSTSSDANQIIIGEIQRVRQALIHMSIYPKSNFFSIDGSVLQYNSADITRVNDIYTYESLTSINIGQAYTTGGTAVHQNYANQVHIFQYLK